MSEQNENSTPNAEPEVVNIDLDAAEPTPKTPSRRRRVANIALAAALATGVTGAGVATYLEKQSKAHVAAEAETAHEAALKDQNTARITIATRSYEQPSVSDVQNDGQVDPTHRKVTFKVQLPESVLGHQYRTKYAATDAPVTWDPTKLTSYVITHDKEGKATRQTTGFGMQNLVQNKDGSYSGEVDPMLKDKVGTEIALYAKNSVWTAQGDTMTTTTGEQYLNTALQLQLVNGHEQWVETHPSDIDQLISHESEAVAQTGN